jgi:sigma-B regulation protein RsbU (phosphoserine phosphatase)
VPTKRPIHRYIVLACLFAIALAYQIRFFAGVLQAEAIHVPFFFTSAGTNEIAYTSPEASAFGVHNRDHLLKVNGVPYSGSGILGRAQRRAEPGVPLVLTVESHDSSEERTISLPVRTGHPGFWDLATDSILQFLLPTTCLLLGFWVAFRRPHDPMAWLLLGLMMSFPHVLESFQIQGWEPGWREAGMLYHAMLDGLFPIAFFLFGRFFPEPFPKGSKYDKGWKLLQWTAALPFGILVFVAIVVVVRDLSDYKSVAALRFFSPYYMSFQILPYVLIGSFFAALGFRLRLSESSDSKRRLRFLFWGAVAAFTPGLLGTAYPRILGKSPNEFYPQWLIVLLLLPLILFPLTLAYVIVVQKAMGVGLALRQGLQYGLARGAFRVLQFVAVSAVVVSAASMAMNAHSNRVQKILVIVIGGALVFTFRWLGARVCIWVDRRFFREAYDAEQVLTELSEQVRSMVEPNSLLETVASRLSETLHIQQLAVLLGGEIYRPAFAMGFDSVPNVSFARGAGTARFLEDVKEPARVYPHDRESWLYSREGMEDEERRRLATLHSELLLPLAVRGKLLGFISLGSKRSEEPYTGLDVRLLKSVATQTGLALENANLMQQIADEIAQRERLNREVEIAREVQERLFPQKLPPIAGLDYAGHCQPALGVGGDYYDFLALPEGHLGVAIGDVSGKGIAAALMMASLQASLRGEAARASNNVAAIVSGVNRLVYEASSANRYATFFYGQYDPSTHKLVYVNAGHNPPMHFRCSGNSWTVDRLETGGTVVGLLESFPYQQGCVSLVPGNILIAFTDGISEAMNREEEEWGESGIIETVKAGPCCQAQAILDRVLAAAAKFVDGAKQHDDMTLVVLRVLA